MLKSRKLLTILSIIVICCSSLVSIRSYAKAENIPTVFLMIQMQTGIYEFPKSIRTFSNTFQSTASIDSTTTKIYGVSEGISEASITFADNTITNYKISTFFPFAQPKTAIIYRNIQNDQMHKWAKIGNTDTISDTVSIGETVTVLYSCKDQTSSEGYRYHYIRTQDGRSGWVLDYNHNASLVNFENKEIELRNSLEVWTGYDNVDEDIINWSSSRPNIASIELKTSGTNKGKGFINTAHQGWTVVTATRIYSSKPFYSSGNITVYETLPPMDATVTKDAFIRNGSNPSNNRATSIAEKDRHIQIIGESGDFYRIGTLQYIEKSHVDITITKILVQEDVELYNQGETHSIQFQIEPRLANMNDVIAESENKEIVDIEGNNILKILSIGETTVKLKSKNSNAHAALVIKTKQNEDFHLNVNYVGFRDVHFIWNYAFIPNSISLQISTDSKSWTSVKNNLPIVITSVSNDNLKQGKEYFYRLKINKSSSQNNGYPSYSNTVKIKTKKFKTFSTDSKIKINFGNGGFKIRRYDVYFNNKFIGFTKNSSTPYTIVNLEKGKNYKLLLKPIYYYYKEIFGKDSSIKQSSTKSNTTDGYFSDKIYFSKDWANMKYTNGRSNMNNWKIKNIKPFVKYNYSSKNKTVYINVYLKISGKGKNKKFTNYSYVYNDTYGNLKGITKISNDKDTYLKIVKSGIKKYWEMKNIQGSNLDFKNNVRFSTKVIFHEKFKKDQNFLRIRIGTENKTPDNNYWHYSISSTYDFYKYSYFIQYNGKNKEALINLATQNQTFKNKISSGKIPETSKKNYKLVAAHEFGHVLGLNDAYTDNASRLARSINSSEVNSSIMFSPRNTTIKNTNDLEMAFNAQGKYFKWFDTNKISNKNNLMKHPTFQSFRTFSQNQFKYVISEVIRKK